MEYILFYTAQEHYCSAENADIIQLLVHINKRLICLVFGIKNETVFLGIIEYSFQCDFVVYRNGCYLSVLELGAGFDKYEIDVIYK